ncbi:hypothetical protein G9A89_010797 [Geosiphon pyriformis]|nr:hypothetical protein G9A89_010797 [Geosiphon pyriformis]
MFNGDGQSSAAPNSPSKKRTYYSDEEEFVCPLCMEEMDLSDRNFRPCPCGYQICRFCWNHIQENLNNRCPACRRIYTEQTIEFTPISSEELARIKNEKKQKEREKKELEAMNRKHLANMRVVQKNLVYVIGLSPKTATEEVLRSHDYFGQYGKIAKIVVNRRNPPVSTVLGAPPPQPSVGVYITYARKEDAAKAIDAVDGSISDGKVLRASYGTTKYCTYYLRNMVCQNPNCMYLHEPGEEADSYTKEDLASAKYHLKEVGGHLTEPIHKVHDLPKVLHDLHKVNDAHKVQVHQIQPVQTRQTQPHPISKPLTPSTPLILPQRKGESLTQNRGGGPESDKSSNDERDEASALPPTASWAGAKMMSPENSPTLHQQSLQSLQSQPLSTLHSTPQLSHQVITSQTSRSQIPLPLQDQEYKLKRVESLDSQGLSAKMEEKTENTPPLSVGIIQQLKEIDQNSEKSKEPRNEAETVKEQAKLIERFSEESIKYSSHDKLTKVMPRSTSELADFDQTLSALTGGSFSFSFNPPSLDVPTPVTETLPDKTPLISSSDLGVLGSSRIVLPPPGVGFPRADSLNTAVSTITNAEFSHPPFSSYTGSFNPFSSDEEKFDRFNVEPPLGILGISSVGSSSNNNNNNNNNNNHSNNNNIAESFQANSNVQTSPSSSVTNKSRQSSRFGFALEEGDNSSLNQGDPLAMKDLQEGLRALFPNVNISFGPSDLHQESMWNTSNDPSFPPLRRPVLAAPPGVPLANPLNQPQSLNASNTSATIEHHFHQNFIMQHHQPPPQLNLGQTPVPTIKAPPPGIYQPSPRMQYGLAPSWNPSMGPWTMDDEYSMSRHPSHQEQQPFMQGLPRPSREDPQNFFTEFLLKAAAASSNSQEDIQAPVTSGEALPFQDPAIMSVRIASSADPAYRAPGAPVMSPQQYQPVQNLGGHRLSVFERVARTSEEQINGGFGVGIGLGNVEQGINNESAEIQTSTTHSDLPAAIEKEIKIQSGNSSLEEIPYPPTKDIEEKPTVQETPPQISRRSSKPTIVKSLVLKMNNGDPSASSQNKPSPNSTDQTFQSPLRQNSSSRSFEMALVSPEPSHSTNIQSIGAVVAAAVPKKREKHVKPSTLTTNKLAGGYHKDSKKIGIAETQIISPITSKPKDNLSKTSVTINVESNKSKSNPNENPIFQSPILSKKPKKKDRNLPVLDGDLIDNEHKKKIMEKEENITEPATRSLNQIQANDQQDHFTIKNKDDNNAIGIHSADSKNNFLADFKFDFASSAFFTMPSGVLSPSSSSKEQIMYSPHQQQSVDPHLSQTSTTFDLLPTELFAKDFNFSTSAIFNLPNSSIPTAAAFFGGVASPTNNAQTANVENDNSHTHLLLGGNVGMWAGTVHSAITGFATMNSANGNNHGSKVPNASVEELEKQVANAKREAEILEHRLRAVIKKNTHHLQDAWK